MGIKGKLSDVLVDTVSDPGKYYDGCHGLFLRVTASGARHWLQRIAVRGRTREFGLGGYPLVTLSEARRLALANRRIARAGGDPSEIPEAAGPALRRAAPAESVPAAQELIETGAPTFFDALEQVIAIQSGRWRNGGKSAGQWRASLSSHAGPVIGGMPVDRITTQDVLEVLRPIQTSKPETARRIRQRIGAVMDWAVACGHRQDNPAFTVGALLPKTPPRRIHFPALPYQDVGEAVRKVLESRSAEVTRLAFAFLVLTACRSGEVRAAEQREIDWNNSVWTIPAGRAKTGRRHRVPLSGGARRLLEIAPCAASDLLWPAASGRAMSDSTLSKMLRTLDIPAVPHGFRSSFRDWASEQARVPREVAETALAHSVYGRTEAAYARSDLLERRRELMQDWCDYLALDLTPA